MALDLYGWTIAISAKWRFEMLEHGHKYDLPLPHLRPKNVQKFELDRALIVDQLAEAANEAWLNDLLPVPSEDIYIQFRDRNGGASGLLVNWDAEKNMATISGCYETPSRKLVPWLCHSLIRDGKVVNATGMGLAAKEINDLAGPDAVNDTTSVFTEAFKCLCMALSCKDVDSVSIGPSERVKRKREAKGLPPLDEYRRLTVKPCARAAYEAAADEKARNGPRLHFRRGHVRTLGSGAKTYVSPAWVGNANLGTITKDYVVKA